MAILAAWAAELLWSGKSRVGPGKVLSLSILDHNVGYRKLPANPQQRRGIATRHSKKPWRGRDNGYVSAPVSPLVTPVLS